MIEPEDIEELVVSTLPQTALFSSRFRECAGRALLLPRRRPDQRTPLWQQRQKAADLLAVAAKYPTFPILLEASRECLQDVFDVPALREVLGQLRSRSVRVVTVDTTKPSPMAQSLLFNWIAAYMYEGDAPLAERRAAALALDRDLLRDLLGAEELRELLDPGVLADVELDLQRLSDGRRARSADELHDVLRRVGDLTVAEVDLRCEDVGPATSWLAELLAEKRAIEVVVAGEARYVAADDAARYRDALGLRAAARAAGGVHRPGAAPARGPRRRATPAPTARSPSARSPTASASPSRACSGALAALEADERVVRGEFRPEGVRREWCDVEVLRQLRRRSLATLRREVEPVEPEALARFLPAWHGIPPRAARRRRRRRGARPARRGADRGVDARDRRARRAGRRLPAGPARRAVHVGRGRVGRRRRDRLDRRAGAARASPTSCRCWRRAGRCRTGRTARCTTRIRARARRARGELLEPAPGGRARHAPTTSCSPRCGTSCGPARSPTTRWRRCGPSPARPRRAHAEAAGGDRAAQRPRPGRLQPDRAAGRGRAAGASSRRCSSRRRRRPRPPTRRRCSSSSATASSPARPCSPRASSAGTPRCTACSRCSRSAARCGAATSSAGSAPPSSRCPAPSTGCASCASAPTTRSAATGAIAAAGRARRHRSGPAVRRHAGLARVAPAARRARRRRVVVLRDGVPIAWYDRRSHHLVTFPHTHDDRSWAEALADLVRDGRLRRVEVRKVDGEPLSTSPVQRRGHGRGQGGRLHRRLPRACSSRPRLSGRSARSRRRAQRCRRRAGRPRRGR